MATSYQSQIEWLEPSQKKQRNTRKTIANAIVSVLVGSDGIAYRKHVGTCCADRCNRVASWSLSYTRYKRSVCRSSSLEQVVRHNRGHHTRSLVRKVLFHHKCYFCQLLYVRGTILKYVYLFVKYIYIYIVWNMCPPFMWTKNTQVVVLQLPFADSIRNLVSEFMNESVAYVRIHFYRALCDRHPGCRAALQHRLCDAVMR